MFFLAGGSRLLFSVSVYIAAIPAVAAVAAPIGGFVAPGAPSRGSFEHSSSAGNAKQIAIQAARARHHSGADAADQSILARLQKISNAATLESLAANTNNGSGDDDGGGSLEQRLLAQQGGGEVLEVRYAAGQTLASNTLGTLSGTCIFPPTVTFEVTCGEGGTAVDVSDDASYGLGLATCEGSATDARKMTCTQPRPYSGGTVAAVVFACRGSTPEAFRASVHLPDDIADCEADPAQLAAMGGLEFATITRIVGMDVVCDGRLPSRELFEYSYLYLASGNFGCQGRPLQSSEVGLCIESTSCGTGSGITCTDREPMEAITVNVRNAAAIPNYCVSSVDAFQVPPPPSWPTHSTALYEVNIAYANYDCEFASSEGYASISCGEGGTLVGLPDTSAFGCTQPTEASLVCPASGPGESTTFTVGCRGTNADQVGIEVLLFPDKALCNEFGVLSYVVHVQQICALGVRGSQFAQTCGPITATANDGIWSETLYEEYETGKEFVVTNAYLTEACASSDGTCQVTGRCLEDGRQAIAPVSSRIKARHINLSCLDPPRGAPQSAGGTTNNTGGGVGGVGGGGAVNANANGQGGHNDESVGVQNPKPVDGTNEKGGVDLSSVSLNGEEEIGGGGVNLSSASFSGGLNVIMLCLPGIVATLAIVLSI